MVLKKIKYSQFEGKPKEWILEEFELDKINLIVGKNASGKSMTLNLISNACSYFLERGNLIYSNGNYEMIFENDKSDSIKFILNLKDRNVLKEELRINDKLYLERNDKGKGKIWYQEIKQMLDFEIPMTQVACAVKRDKTQHPFLEYLYEWADNLRKFDFGSDLGKLQLHPKTSFDETEINPQLTNVAVAQVFNVGYKKHKNFKKEIFEDMKKIGYEISDIYFSETGQFNQVFSETKQTVYGLAVQEVGLKGETRQIDMSQGMFRALSLIIQLNYYFLSQKNGCIVVDDIGEGLDFERSKALIKLLVEKAEKSNIQLIMSTNDRFVMNNVPLEYWAIIHREGSKVKIINYKNSKEIFDKFEYTGLDNFDFFTSQYYLIQKK